MFVRAIKNVAYNGQIFERGQIFEVPDKTLLNDNVEKVDEDKKSKKGLPPLNEL